MGSSSQARAPVPSARGRSVKALLGLLPILNLRTRGCLPERNEEITSLWCPRPLLGIAGACLSCSVLAARVSPERDLVSREPSQPVAVCQASEPTRNTIPPALGEQLGHGPHRLSNKWLGGSGNGALLPRASRSLPSDSPSGGPRRSHSAPCREQAPCMVSSPFTGC